MNEEIYSDIKRFKQLLINLISNAFKFTTRGGISISMNLKQADNQQQDCSKQRYPTRILQLKVEDTGLGMKEQDMSKLFRVFGKGIDRYKINQGGTGLGLTICKKIVEGMKGNI